MKRNKILASVSTVALALGALATFGGNHVDAATKSITPALPYRYKTDTAYFLDKSTSAHYKGVWNSATNAWKKNGFAWKAAANHSKTTLSSATLTIALQASMLRAMTRFNTIKPLEKLFLVKCA